MINANGKTPFAEHGGLRFALDPASSLFVPETVALGGAETRAPAPPPFSGAPRVAMLIDGDNAQPSAKIVERVLSAAQKRGDVTVRRVYGNWSSSNMSGGSEIARSFAIRPVHQVATAAGKNAADIALVIDAMEVDARRDGKRILHSVQRQRLYGTGTPNPRTGHVRDWRGTQEHACLVRERLR